MAELTTERKSGAGSRTSRQRWDRSPQTPPPSREQAKDDALRTARALRLVYTVALPRLERDSARAVGPGLSAPSWVRMIQQDQVYFRQLARELGDATWMELQRAAAHPSSEHRRIVREHLEESAQELALYVETLAPPVASVLRLRSCLPSWKAVLAHHSMNGRATFSVMDDWEAGLRRVWSERGDLVRALI